VSDEKAFSLERSGELGRKMSWIYLILAGVFEIGWPLGLKLAQGSAHRLKGIVLAVVAMVVSGGLLWLA
jgi:quaternary ammonium compound-resistance protein SugE